MKVDDYFHRIVFDNILYLKSEHNYVNIHTLEHKVLIRATLQDIFENLDDRFIRIHRSYVVNSDKIDKINTSNILINGCEIPVSGNFRDDLLRRLTIR